MDEFMLCAAEQLQKLGLELVVQRDIDGAVNQLDLSPRVRLPLRLASAGVKRRQVAPI